MYKSIQYLASSAGCYKSRLSILQSSKYLRHTSLDCKSAVNSRKYCVFPTHDKFADRHLGVNIEDAAVMLDEIGMSVSFVCYLVFTN